MRGGVGGQRRQSDHWLGGGQRNAARGGEADAQTGETAGSGGDCNTVECAEGDAGLLDDARQQRHQRLGVSALHRQRFLGNHPVGFGVQHAGSAGIEGGIDRKNEHAQPRRASQEIGIAPKPPICRSNR